MHHIKSHHAYKPCSEGETALDNRPESVDILQHLLGPDAGKVERGLTYTHDAKNQWIGHMRGRNEGHHENIRKDEFYDHEHNLIRRKQYPNLTFIPGLDEYLRNASDSERLILEKFIDNIYRYNPPKEPLKFNHEGGYRRKYRELHTWLSRDQQPQYPDTPPPTPPAHPVPPMAKELTDERPTTATLPDVDESNHEIVELVSKTEETFREPNQRPASCLAKRPDTQEAFHEFVSKQKTETELSEKKSKVKKERPSTAPALLRRPSKPVQSSRPSSAVGIPDRTYEQRPMSTKEVSNGSSFDQRPIRKLTAKIKTDTGQVMQKKFVHKVRQGNWVPADERLVPVTHTRKKTDNGLSKTLSRSAKSCPKIYNRVQVVDANTLPYHLERQQSETWEQTKQKLMEQHGIRTLHSKSLPIPASAKDTEHKYTNFSQIDRHVIGKKGHFVIHPQLISETSEPTNQNTKKTVTWSENAIQSFALSSKDWKEIY